jgi:hypothetical protein
MRILTQAEAQEMRIISGQIDRPEDQVRRIQKEWGLDKILQRPYLDALTCTREYHVCGVDGPCNGYPHAIISAG